MAEFGLVGLGIMGRNLALNARDHGRRVIGYDVDATARLAFAAAGETTDSLVTLVAGLRAPRLIVLLVPAGKAVDEQLTMLSTLLSPGDIVVDAGNSHFRDSERRASAMGAAGFHFVGLGISGGEEGARRGPAMMAGGGDDALDRVQEVLSPLAALAGDRRCHDRFGGGGAGHFVKMVHNGIEYAVMQMLAEAYALLRHGSGMTPNQVGACFESWNDGALGSYLVDISGRVLKTDDPQSGLPLVDVIIDAAAQKGTGHWAVSAALEMGVPVPSLAAAVNARCLSALSGRSGATGPAAGGVDCLDGGSVRDALMAGILCAYAQGFHMLDAGARHHGWPLDPAVAAANWRGGCIIRARVLDEFAHMLRSRTADGCLLADPEFGQKLAGLHTGWRRAVSTALTAGLPVPGLSSALDYWVGYGGRRSGAELIQAQRDYFGAHGFRRIDGEGTFHGPWRNQA